MTQSSPEDKEILRIPRTGFYPKVGDPLEKLDQVTPPVSKALLDAVVSDAKANPQLSFTLKYRHLGDDPKELVIELRGPQQVGDQISVEISGDWESKLDVLQGVPVIADYGGPEGGTFYRRLSPQAEDPIAKDGDILEPTKPMVIGLASVMKQQYWAYELDPLVFPNGVRIARFLAPDIKEGVDIVAGETILCYVVPL